MIETNFIPGLLGDLIPVPVELSPEEREMISVLESTLFNKIAPVAIENDKKGRYPHLSIQALVKIGIFKSSLLKELGGFGFSQRFSFEVQLRIARVDSSVAQIFKVHDELVREIPFYSNEAQRNQLAEFVRGEDAILGLAVAEPGRTAEDALRTSAVRQDDGSYLLNGVKIYTTGAAGADYIATWAYDSEEASVENPFRGMKLFLVPRETAGITIHLDWDAMGQRSTDSGKVTFDMVRCPSSWISSIPGQAPLDHASLRYQAGFAALLTGIGIGALESAAPFVRDQSRPWLSAGVKSATEDPLLQLRAGEFAADLVGAYYATMSTAERFDAYESNAISRGALALSVSAAKITANNAAIRTTTGLHALMGTRSVATKYAFDLFWRNARTLSLHDPVDYKSREVGLHIFTGEHPKPGVYQ
mgnify:CR=1 FL=1